MGSYDTTFAFPQGGSYMIVGADANGLPCIIASGQATDDATIVSQVGADSNWADGSLYISCVDGGGGLWQKANDVWSEIS